MAVCSRIAIASALAFALMLSFTSGCGPTQAQLRARAEEQERARQQVLANEVEQGRQELSRDNPKKALAWLESAYDGGSTEPSLPYLLGEAVRASSAVTALFEGHRGAISDAGFSPDGRRVLTAGADGTARIWDVAEGRLRLSLSGHMGPVLSAAWSPDGRRVITGGADGTARVFDADSGRQLAELRGHSLAVVAASFSPDGRAIVTASNVAGCLSRQRVGDAVGCGHVADSLISVLRALLKFPSE